MGPLTEVTGLFVLVELSSDEHVGTHSDGNCLLSKAATCRTQGSTLVASASSTGIAVQEGSCQFQSWSAMDAIFLVDNQPDGVLSRSDLILIEFDAIVAIEVWRHLASGKSVQTVQTAQQQARQPQTGDGCLLFEHIGNKATGKPTGPTVASLHRCTAKRQQTDRCFAQLVRLYRCYLLVLYLDSVGIKHFSIIGSKTS
jgi:hypothetical protein